MGTWNLENRDSSIEFGEIWLLGTWTDTGLKRRHSCSQDVEFQDISVRGRYFCERSTGVDTQNSKP